MRRVLGIIVILVGITGLLLSVGIVVVGFSFVDSAVDGVLRSLDLAQESLDTVVESLELTKTTVSQMNDTLATVEDTADNVAITLQDTQPLLDQVSVVTTENVPASLEAVQNSIPALVEVAGVIDSTLTTLSAFSIEQDLGPLLPPLNVSLGVDYSPEQPFDQSIQDLGSSLDGLPEQLRALETQLAVSSQNLANISGNIGDLADNISAINESIAGVIPLLDDYIGIVQEVGTGLDSAAATIEAQAQNVKYGIIGIAVWFALYQLVPLYVGWLMVRGDGREKDREERETPAAVEAEPQPDEQATLIVDAEQATVKADVVKEDDLSSELGEEEA